MKNHLEQRRVHGNLRRPLPIQDLIQQQPQQQQQQQQHQLEENHHSSSSETLSSLDFCTNDYLGLAHCPLQKTKVDALYEQETTTTKISTICRPVLGATGSRLLSGDSVPARQLEHTLAIYHSRDSATLFNSGYDANLSVLSSILFPGDVILMDELCHNSIVMGIRSSRIMGQNINSSSSSSSSSSIFSKAPVQTFAHSNVVVLKDLLDLWQQQQQQEMQEQQQQRCTIPTLTTATTTTHENAASISCCFIVVESVYSMDGDVAILTEILDLALLYTNVYVIVDEAHGLGIYGRTNSHDLPISVLRNKKNKNQNNSGSHNDHHNRHTHYEVQKRKRNLRKNDEHLHGHDAFNDNYKNNNTHTTTTTTKTTTSIGGTGVLAALELEDHPALLCSIHTFGKAAGCHGAVVCGSQLLRMYLWNYARPFVYSTAMPFHSIITIAASYDIMISKHEGDLRRTRVFQHVQLFRKVLLKIINQTNDANDNSNTNTNTTSKTTKVFLWPSPTPIQALLLSGTTTTTTTAIVDYGDNNNNNNNRHEKKKTTPTTTKDELCVVVFCQIMMQEYGIRLYPIRAPTVPRGQERVRIILHAHNSKQNVIHLCQCIQQTLRTMGILQLPQHEHTSHSSSSSSTRNITTIGTNIIQSKL